MASIRGISHKAVLVHYIAGAAHLLALPVLFFFSASDMGGHFFAPHVLALVHLCVLGWFLPVTFGATYQLLPSMAGREARFKKLPLPALAVYLAGVWLLVYGLWYFRAGALLLIAGSLVLAGIAGFVINMLWTAEGGKRGNIQLQFMQASLLWLLLTAIFGFLLALNLTSPFMTMDHIRVLKVHAHMGLIGWFMQLIMGAGLEMMPHFFLAKPLENRRLAWVLYLFNTGLLLLFPAFLYAASPGWYLLPGIAAIGTALSLFAQHMYITFKTRERRTLDWPLRFNMLCWPLLAVAMLAGLISAFIQAPDAFRPAFLYIFLFLFGFVAFTIIAHSFKMLPFEVWLFRFSGKSDRHNRRPPDLFSKRLFVGTITCYSCFLLTGVLGLAFQFPILMQLSAILLILAAAAYGLNIVKVVRQVPE